MLKKSCVFLSLAAIAFVAAGCAGPEEKLGPVSIISANSAEWANSAVPLNRPPYLGRQPMDQRLALFTVSTALLPGLLWVPTKS